MYYILYLRGVLFMDIKNSYATEGLGIDGNVVLSDKSISEIIGSNSEVKKLYSEGRLDALLITGIEGGSYVTKSLGDSCECPDKLVEFFKLVSLACGDTNSEKLDYLGIYCKGNDVFVSALCNTEYSDMYMLNFFIDGTELSLCGDDVSYVSNSDLIPQLCSSLGEVLGWASCFCPAPVYCIEYFGDGCTSAEIGKSKYSFGVCEAVVENGVANIDSASDNVYGKYALVFVEE